MAQLKTDPAKKGLTPLKSIAQKAKDTGTNQYYTIAHPEYVEPYKQEDSFLPVGFTLPKGLSLKEYNEAIDDYGSRDAIDVEDYKAKRQGLFETIAKGTAGLLTNALLDVGGILGTVYGTLQTAGEFGGSLLTGNLGNKSWTDFTNNFSAEDNELLAFVNNISKATNEALHIHKTREERGEIAPLSVGTLMEAVSQLGHALPAVGLMALGVPPPVVSLLSGVNEAQMEVNSSRDSINATRDERNFQTYLDAIKAKENMLSGDLKEFDRVYDEYDRQARAQGLIDPNDRRTPNERKLEARREYAEQLLNGKYREASGVLDKSAEDIINKTTGAYKKYADEALGAMFLIEGTALSFADYSIMGVLNKVGGYGKNLLSSNISKKILGEGFANRIGSSVAKNTVTSSAKELVETTLDKTLTDSTKDLAKRTGIKAIGKRLGKIASMPINEALQEMGQEGLSQASEAYTENLIDQYIKAQYDYDKVDRWEGVSAAMVEGAQGFISTSALQQGAIAALSTFIGVSPNIHRQVDPSTGKKRGFPIKHNLWEQWKGLSREDADYNSYVDTYTQSVVGDKREALQESYRQLFAYNGLDDVAKNLRNQGKINEAEDSELLGIYNFINAAVQLGKTKEAFSMLNYDPANLTDQEVSDIVEKSTTTEFDPFNNEEVLRGPYVQNGRKLNQSAEDLQKVREGIKANLQQFNELWDTFDEAKKQVDERYDGYDFTKEQKSTLTFMYALKQNMANKAKEHLDNLYEFFDVTSSLDAINAEIAKIRTAQQNNLANDSLEDFESKNSEIYGDLKALYAKRQSLEELKSVLDKGVKFNPDNVSEKTLDKLSSIFRNELEVNPQSGNAIEGLTAIASLKSIMNTINKESTPNGSFVEKVIKKYNAEAKVEVENEVNDILDKEYKEALQAIKEVNDELEEGNYGSEYQRDRDLYKFDTLMERLKDTRPEVLASYLEVSKYRDRAYNIISNLAEEQNTKVAQALAEYIASKDSFDIEDIISSDDSDLLQSLIEKYDLGSDDANELLGIITSLANVANNSYKNRVANLKSGKLTPARVDIKVPNPSSPSPMTPNLVSEEVIANKNDGTVEAIDEETSEVVPINPPIGPDSEEVSKVEESYVETLDNKEITFKDGFEEGVIIPATSEHDKQTYNDIKGAYIPAIDALNKKGLDDDTANMIRLTYTELRDSGAFEYLDSGKLEIGDELVYGVEPSFEEKKSIISDASPYKQPTVFIYSKESNGTLQKLGELFTNDQDKPSNNAIRQLATEAYDKSDKTTPTIISRNDAPEELHSFFDVADVTGGIIRYTDKYEPIRFDVSNAHIGVNTGSSLVTNASASNHSILVRNETLKKSRGSVIILLPDIHGDLHPAFISLPTLGEALLESPNTGAVAKVDKLIRDLANVHNKTTISGEVIADKKAEVELLVEQLQKYLDFGKDLFITYKEDDKGPRLLVGRFVRDEKGNRKTRTTVKNGKARTSFYSNIEAIPLTDNIDNTIESIRSKLSSALFYPRIDDLKADTTGQYSRDFLTIARTNIQNPQLGSVFFSAGEIALGESKRNADAEINEEPIKEATPLYTETYIPDPIVDLYPHEHDLDYSEPNEERFKNLRVIKPNSFEEFEELIGMGKSKSPEAKSAPASTEEKKPSNFLDKLREKKVTDEVAKIEPVEDLLAGSNEDNILFRHLSSASPINLDLELDWANNALGWRINKQIRLNEYKVDKTFYDGYYDKKTGKITIHSHSLEYVLFHEAFHKIFHENLSLKDKNLLLGVLESKSFLQAKNEILNDTIDEVFTKNSEEILAELFAEYVGANVYKKTQKQKDIILALKKIESIMKFDELVKAIENNKPIKYRTSYSPENEQALRSKHWLTRTFLKMVNMFRARTKSFRRSDGYLPVTRLFDAINSGAFNKSFSLPSTNEQEVKTEKQELNNNESTSNNENSSSNASVDATTSNDSNSSNDVVSTNDNPSYVDDTDDSDTDTNLEKEEEALNRPAQEIEPADDEEEYDIRYGLGYEEMPLKEDIFKVLPKEYQTVYTILHGYSSDPQRGLFLEKTFYFYGDPVIVTHGLGVSSMRWKRNPMFIRLYFTEYIKHIKNLLLKDKTINEDLLTGEESMYHILSYDRLSNLSDRDAAFLNMQMNTLLDMLETTYVPNYDPKVAKDIFDRASACKGV